MSRPFSNGTPNLSNSDYNRDKRGKVMYNHMVNVAVNKKCQTQDGKTKIDCSGYLINADSYETFLSLRRGSALCAPCDISGLLTNPEGIKCVCRVPMPTSVEDSILSILAAAGVPDVSNALLHEYGLGPDWLYLPWQVLQQPESWNSSATFFDATDVTSITINDISKNKFSHCPFDLSGVDGSKNVITMSGGVLPNIYGGWAQITNMDNQFGNDCNSVYYPVGTFSFSLKEIIEAWLYLYAPIAANNPLLIELVIIVNALHGGGYGAARPRVTVDNYLSFYGSPNAPMRFFQNTSS